MHKDQGNFLKGCVRGDEVEWESLSKCVRTWLWFSTLQLQIEKAEPGKDLSCVGETEQRS